MVCLQEVASLLLLLFVTADPADYFDPHANDLCFMCSCTPDETKADCSERGLDYLPDGESDKVTILNISNNEFSIFPHNLANFYSLVVLDISRNRLIELPGEAFNNLTALEIVNLSNNKFESWINLNPNMILQPAKSLKVLDLSHNRFTTLGNLANQELLVSSSLETLILDDCEISSIHGRSPISGLTGLKSLAISNNPLQRILGLISPTLQEIHASNCQISTMNHNELTYLPSLINLNLSYNYRLEMSTNSYTLFSDSIQQLDISFCNVMYPSLQGFPNLKHAIVRHNIIRYLDSHEFINNTKLEYLDLSYNKIGSMKSDTFHGLYVLKKLDLSWNEIAEIPDNTFLEITTLTHLKLARNYLTKVGHLKSLSITKLDMSSCELSIIHKDSLEGLQSLKDINLSRNLLSFIPVKMSSNTLKYLNLNYNRLTDVNNQTFSKLPQLTALAVIGNRFTSIWSKDLFESNPELTRLDLNDNLWRCDCNENMFEFYEFLTLEPNKKEESYNLVCSSPANLAGQSWLDACFYVWNPSTSVKNPDTLIYFIVVMIVGLSFCLILVNLIRRSMKHRLARIQEERERQVAEARERLRQIRLQSEQVALCNAPDPRDLVSPPSYAEALSMPKLNVSCHSLCEAGTGKTKRKRGRRKTKSSGDLIEETERNGDLPVLEEIELAESSENNNRRRRTKKMAKCGSQEITNLDHSPGARRRRMSELEVQSRSVEVEADIERPLGTSNRRRRYSSDESNNDL